MMLAFKPITNTPLQFSTSASSSRPFTTRCSSKLSTPFVPLTLRSGDGSSESPQFWRGSIPGGNDEEEEEEEEEVVVVSGGGGEEESEEKDEERGISGIHVPKQKYISVSKAALLDAVIGLFSSQEEVDEFKRFARYLDAILHAEHKGLLEEMRAYYMLTHQEENGPSSAAGKEKPKVNGKPSGLVGLRNIGDTNDEEDDTFFFRRTLVRSLLGLPPSASETRVADATHFQRSFMKLLRDAQFEELSAQDLLLTDALNSDYLLTLPIYVDWKRAADSNAIIFRRGYATEKQKGLLLAEKLDYLQSKLLQKIFFSFSRPLKNLGKLLNEALKRSTGKQDLQIWIDKLKLWLKEQYYPENSLSFLENNSWDKLRSDQFADADPPIWIAAQRAVSRYEGFLSPVGPRGRLIRKLLTWTGLIPSLPDSSIYSEIDTKYTESYLRTNFLPRITLSNIWEPASKESCNYSVWEMLKASFSILFGQSTLQEPAFQELILLYTDEATQSKARDKTEMLPLQLKIYERIPIPDLAVVFPHKKLSFRILDTVRLDLATVVGLLAYLVNYKFESIASSLSAISLDVVAASALVILVFRVVLGYKQTWDRYQLLVNKTLYEKTLASGFGSVHFLLDASEQQQYKEALLVYALLLFQKGYQVFSPTSIRDTCEQFLHEKFKAKIEMPIDKAMETLLRLGLVIELPSEGDMNVVALQCSKANEILRKRWDSLLEQKT